MDADGLLHELWHSVEDSGEEYTFCLAGPHGDGARKTLGDGARLIWTVWARSHFEAMTLYWQRQDWGIYTTDQAWDYEPYPVEWVDAQRCFLASCPPETGA